jgi:hypothetical protein
VAVALHQRVDFKKSRSVLDGDNRPLVRPNLVGVLGRRGHVAFVHTRVIAHTAVALLETYGDCSASIDASAVPND